MSRSFSDFVLHLDYQDLPAATRHTLRRSTLDTLGVAMVGSTTDMSRRAREFAHRFWGSGADTPAVRMLLDGREASLPGAVMAGAFTIDAVDGHDGHRIAKGHAGSAVYPALLAAVQYLRAQGVVVSGRDFLSAVAVGYEVSYRTALAQHATTSDYHTSGAWTAVGVAAMLARLLGLDGQQLREAVGIAEYHGPRSPMMRCIEFPTHVRDGVGWGAPSGVSAALLAKLGFTGAPAATVESEATAEFWAELGERWEIDNTYYKPYPVCRWAHPALDGVAALRTAHDFRVEDILRVRIRTFHYATTLAGHAPRTLDEFCYAIAFPVATMAVRGRLGPEELDPAVLDDPTIQGLAQVVELVEHPPYTALSPAERWADVTVYLRDGRVLEDPPRTARGDPHQPLSDDELVAKYHGFADPLLGPGLAAEIRDLSLAVDEQEDLGHWLALLHLGAAKTAI